MLHLAVRLARARAAAGLSREQTAVATGKSFSTISAYERGDITPPLAVLQTLAALYRTTPAELLRDADR